MLTLRIHSHTRALLLCWLLAFSAAACVFSIVQHYDHIRPWYIWRVYAPAGLFLLLALSSVLIHALWQRDWRRHCTPATHLVLCLGLLWLAPKLGHHIYGLKETRSSDYAYQIENRLEDWRTTHGSYPPALSSLNLPKPIFTHSFLTLDYRLESPTNYYFYARSGRFEIVRNPDGTGHRSFFIVCH
jgi:hypothetical protein